MMLATYANTTLTRELRRGESIDLRKVALFSALDEEALELIQDHALTRTLNKGANVLQAGDSTESVYVVLSGRAKVFLSNEDGKELVLGSIGPGESFGEAALLEGAHAHISVATLETTRLLVIAREVLSEIAQHDAGFALQIAQRLAQQVLALTGQVRNLGLCNVYQRLAHVLCAMAQPAERRGAAASAGATAAMPLVIEQRFTHQELAKRIGASREMVTRIFRDLIIGGYLVLDGKRLIIAKKLPASW